MLVDVIDLGDQPDPGAEEHGSEEADGFAQGGTLAFPDEREARAVGGGNGTQDDGQLDPTGNGLPVVGEEQDDSQADDNSAKSGKEDQAEVGGGGFGISF